MNSGHMAADPTHDYPPIFAASTTSAVSLSSTVTLINSPLTRYETITGDEIAGMPQEVKPPKDQT
jgi:hypothetical protein